MVAPSGGASNQLPLLLLVSFDGFRWDYLNNHNLSNFEYLKKIGSHADFVYNSFSTVTFPNHWSMVTGLYEESHGIVNNHMFDPVLNKTFQVNESEAARRQWFGQNKITQPIWSLNQKSGKGRLSAAEWIGSDILFNNQSIIHIPYEKSKDYKTLIDNFIDLFTDPNGPINFGAVYFDQPDLVGHEFGPFSQELKEKLAYLNQILGYLIDQLKSNYLFDKMNLIVTSDHGMQATSPQYLITLDSFIDTSLVDVYGGSCVANIFLKNTSNLDSIYAQLKKIKNVDIYKRDEIPSDLHYKENVRIGDLVAVASLGYTISTNNNSNNKNYQLQGSHGYYNNETSMFPIFIAQGPAFKKNFKIENFHIVDIYPLMCKVLNIEPGVNNGSLHIIKEMLIDSKNNPKLTIYVILSLTPIVSAFVTAVLLVYLDKRFIQKNAHNNNGYVVVATSETNQLINEDDDDDSLTLYLEDKS